MLHSTPVLPISFSSQVNGVEFLIEVSSTAKNIPGDWVVISTTAKYARYHSPYIVAKVS